MIFTKNIAAATAMLVGLLPFALAPAAAAETEPVDYNRDIRPILSNNCFQCHGPDEKERQSGLRLDVRASAIAEAESGSVAIVPGKSGESELLARVTSDDEYLRMPPPDTNKTLTKKQIDLLKRWIEQGAEYRRHWSFEPPEQPPLPTVQKADWPKNAIDYFVLARLEQEGLYPNEPASRAKLIRRVTFDLTGLPPTIEEVEAFVADKSPDAYERLVDRLLASPRFGEHIGRYWLDAARYGDTHGLHLDNYREMWPYRDWVVRAFNDNKPFDAFTVEQLAGDLLPEPTLDQRVASGFNRCNVSTSEGGAIAEEFRVRYAVDRTETVSTVWLGMTMGCSVCHDHKYDPISQQDFYSLYAFYNNAADPAMDGNKKDTPPTIRVPTLGQRRKLDRIAKREAELQREIAAALASFEYAEPPAEPQAKPAEPRDVVWIDDALPPGAQAQGDTPWEFVTDPVHSGEKATKRSAGGRSQHFFTDAQPGLRIGAGDVLFAHVYLDPKNPPQEIMLQFNDGAWEHRAYWGKNLIDWGAGPGRVAMGELPEAGKWVRLEVPAEKVGLKPGAVLNGWAFTQFGGTVYWDTAGVRTQAPQDDRHLRSLAAWVELQRSLGGSDLPGDVKQAIQAEKPTAEQLAAIRTHYLANVFAGTRELMAPFSAERAKLTAERSQIEQQMPLTFVMADSGNRPTYVLHRGEYDKPMKDQQVAPRTPEALPPLPEGAPANRLGLAKWLVDPRNPLPARVTVNRLWQQFFGTGIVLTSEDFGSQGQWPSHPKLLDRLAVEFQHDWDVKRLVREIVLSATYRQSAEVTQDKLQRDPQNRLLARGPRFRLDAEMIRDNALYVSGLLVEKLGGPSVKPYQPAGLWEAVGYTDSNTARFKRDAGEKLYRRSVYTFWKRTSPPPAMETFNAPTREACTVRRERTNTPLQALTLMNDVQFVEAARHFAERIQREGGESVDSRLRFAIRTTLARDPSEQELAVYRRFYEQMLAKYQSDVEAAKKLLGQGESPRDAALDPAATAAWTMVANLLLNLDETITKG